MASLLMLALWIWHLRPQRRRRRCGMGCGPGAGRDGRGVRVGDPAVGRRADDGRLGWAARSVSLITRVLATRKCAYAALRQVRPRGQPLVLLVLPGAGAPRGAAVVAGAVATSVESNDSCDVDRRRPGCGSRRSGHRQLSAFKAQPVTAGARRNGLWQHRGIELLLQWLVWVASPSSRRCRRAEESPGPVPRSCSTFYVTGIS